jgi:hypothetical protein
VAVGVYLRACAASFMMASMSSWTLDGDPLSLSTLRPSRRCERYAAPAPLTSASTDGEGQVSRWDEEEIVFRIMDPFMDEYLDERVNSAKRSFLPFQSPKRLACFLILRHLSPSIRCIYPPRRIYIFAPISLLDVNRPWSSIPVTPDHQVYHSQISSYPRTDPFGRRSQDRAPHYSIILE